MLKTLRSKGGYEVVAGMCNCRNQVLMIKKGGSLKLRVRVNIIGEAHCKDSAKFPVPFGWA